jgi:hypothetical protein
MNNKIFAILMLILVFGSGCAPFKGASETSNGPSNVQTAAYEPSAEFYALSATTEGQISYRDYLGNVQLGASISERNKYSGSERIEFCRKSGAVVPNPEYHYSCYLPILSGAEAEAKFNEIGGIPYILIGSTFGTSLYTSINERRSSDQKTICQVFTTNGNAYSYACFLQR